MMKRKRASSEVDSDDEICMRQTKLQCSQNFINQTPMQQSTGQSCKSTSNVFHAPELHNWSVSYDIVPSPQLTKEDFNSCFELIKTTSRADYVASSQGWDSSRKIKEMKHPEMQYILIRYCEHDPRPSPGSLIQSSTASKSPHAAAPDALSDNDAKPSVAVTSTDISPNNGESTAVTATPPSPSPVVGFLSFVFEKDDPPNDHVDVVYIYEIHLSASLRGAGLGAHLLTVVEDICYKQKFSKVMLTVFTRNKAASAFYRKCGYYIDEDSSPRSREVRGRKIPPDYRIRSKYLGQIANPDRCPLPDVSEANTKV
ncbi:hypothetical protein BU24DRAFT_424605 [Aaosphaeria arxii CBS 175.79]|uniref:N-alpha-acetyltransferase 40 n=1 Tax=Aaosphaeria arxii CBS 175.79 TaxID=1450172 RepID=A0A6A5XL43_9PLEO|nr:uncharacterized protein BU24DRAFT_424605 [Aaosphaeria arxii CBS 175.79]KAF2013606.1 hypothetical protein BU24DRAFT_424605 [Aaosphaeria arxii CBS 175.79]